MPKHFSVLEIPFQALGIHQVQFCPQCGYVLKAVIPATSITYLVHFFGNPCVIDNLPLKENDVTVVQRG